MLVLLCSKMGPMLPDILGLGGLTVFKTKIWNRCIYVKYFLFKKIMDKTFTNIHIQVFCEQELNLTLKKLPKPISTSSLRKST